MNRKKYKVDQSPDDNLKDIDITIFWHESIPQSSKNITDRLNNSVYRLKVNKELEALNRCLLRANKLIRSPEKVDNYYANSSVDKKVELISDRNEITYRLKNSSLNAENSRNVLQDISQFFDRSISLINDFKLILQVDRNVETEQENDVQNVQEPKELFNEMNTMMQRYKEEINTAHENAIQLLVEQNKRMQKKRRFEKNTKISQIDVKVCPNRKINQISATKIKPSVVDKSRKSSALSLKLRQLETDVNIKEDTISQLTEQNFKYNGMIQYVVKVVVDFEKLQINKMEEFKAFFNAEAIQISEKMNKMFNNLKKKITSENDLNHHLKTFDDNFFVFEIIKQDASLLENIFLNINETTQKGLIKEFKQKFVEKINHISIGVQTQNIAKTCNTPISVESSETPESFNTKTAASTTTTSSHSIKSCFQSGHEKNVEKVENDSYESGCKSDDSSVQKNSVGEGSSIPSINKLELKSNDIDSPHNSSIVCSRSNNEIKYSNSHKSEISEILENIKKKKSLNNSNTISECSSILHNKILQSSLESIIRKSTSKSTLGKFDDGNIDQQNKTQNISKSKKNVYHSDAFDSDSESSPIFKSKSRDSFKMDSPFSGNMSVPQRKPSKIQRRKSAKTRKAKSFSKSPTLQKSESFRDILNVDTNMKNSFSNIKPSDKISIKLSSSNESDFNKSQKNENIFLNSLSEIIQNFIFRFSDLLNNYGYNTFSILLDEVENNIKSRISYSLIYKTLNDLFHIIFDNMTNMLSQESVSELWNLTRNESLILPPKKCDETSVSVDNFVSQSHAVQTAPIVYDDFVKEFNEKKNVLFESPKKQGPQNSKILDYKIKNREIDQLNNLFIYFSKMNQNRNRRMLDNALCRRKIKQDLHTKLSKEMAQYRQISRSQLHLLIVKYSLVKNMEFIKTKMTDEKVFDKLYKYEGKKIKSFKLIQNRLHEARNILAEKLSFAFSNLQQESGLFLIKPIYSYSKIQSLLYEPIEIDDKKKRIMINPYKNQKNKEITVSGTQVTRKNGSNIYKSKVWIPDEATNQAYNSVCKNMPTLLDIDVSRIVYRHNLPLNNFQNKDGTSRNLKIYKMINRTGRYNFKMI